MDSKISAVLIAKNEEALIGRCIRSLTGLDEIVVLDTGSKDRTMKIAKDAGAQTVLAMELEPIVPFHFAVARNRAAAVAANDWILSIDCDEVLRSGSVRKIRKAIEESNGNSAFRTTFVGPYESGGRVVTIQKTKIFRRDRFEWRYRCHELLGPLGTHCSIGDLSAVVIEHLPSADKTVRRGQNIELLLLTIKETPEYVRAFRHLGMELKLAKRQAEAIPYLAEYVERTDESPLEKSQVAMYLGACYAETERLEDAVKWFEIAASIDPSRREPLYFAGWWLMNKGPTIGHVERAASYFEKALLIPAKGHVPGNLDEPYVWASEPRRLLARCQEVVNQAKMETLRKT